MPFLPPAASVAQANAFARRLAYQLTPARRAALMPFQEALARAAGYPHAHAWHQRLRRGDDRLPALYGAHPGRLASWGKALWKANPHWRHQRMLSLVEVQSALAKVWGWSSWVEVEAEMVATRSAHPNPGAIGTWAVAPTVTQLACALAPHQPDRVYRMVLTQGLHLALGTTPEGAWVGWGIQEAGWRHPLVRGGQPGMRRHLAMHWIHQRLLQGDRLWVGVAPDQAGVLTDLRDWALSQGRSADLHAYDYRKDSQPLPKVSVSSGVLTQVTLQQAFSESLTSQHIGAMFTWVDTLASAFRYLHPDPSSLAEWLRWLTEPYAKVRELVARREELPDPVRRLLLDIMARVENPPAPTGQVLDIGGSLARLKAWAQTLLSCVQDSDEREVSRQGDTIAAMVLPTEGPLLGWVSWLWQTALGGYIGGARDTPQIPLTLLSLDLPLGWGWAPAVTPATGQFTAAIIQILPRSLDTVTQPMAGWAQGLRLELGETIETPATLSAPGEDSVKVFLDLGTHDSVR